MPAGPAALPAVAAAAGFSSSQLRCSCSVVASAASTLLASLALEAARVVVEGRSSERGKLVDLALWPELTEQCGGLMRLETRVVGLVVEVMMRPGEERRGVRLCRSCSWARRGSGPQGRSPG